MSDFYTAGYVTVTHTQERGDVYYGVFDTRDEAEAWGKNLINYEIRVINAPLFNEGGRGE